MTLFPIYIYVLGVYIRYIVSILYSYILNVAVALILQTLINQGFRGQHWGNILIVNVAPIKF
nr:MAG TPA: hypothetical protein [Caudoviricetes sp.]